jgi:hypothetical protein
MDENENKLKASDTKEAIDKDKLNLEIQSLKLSIKYYKATFWISVFAIVISLFTLVKDICN